MNGNVKVYLALAIVILWAHTLFTAHELVSQGAHVPASGAMKHIKESFLKKNSSHSSFARFFPSQHGPSGGLALGGDDVFNRYMAPAEHVVAPAHHIMAATGGAPGGPVRRPSLPAASSPSGGGGGGSGGSAADEDEFHVVFSTDCSAYQHWQSIVCFYSALRVGQRGTITRIASGCTPEEETAVSALHALLPAQFKVHFTPDFKEDKKTGKRYDFFNKPFGTLHWLHHGSGIGPDAVVALIDPDFVFLRPLSATVGEPFETVVSGPVKYGDLPRRVTKGFPVGQQYGLGDHWLKFNRPYVCGAGSPCTTTTSDEAFKYFPVGPPYIAHRADLEAITVIWADFVPRIYEEYPHLLAEMYGYCMAAAHLGLKHGRLDHMMVSNTLGGGEGWPLVDALGDDRLCRPWTSEPGDVTGDGAEGHMVGPLEHSRETPLPTFVHMCQSYRVDDWFFHKRQVPTSKADVRWPQPAESVLSCAHALPGPPPPRDLPKRLWQRKPHNETVVLKPQQAKRQAFMVCTIYNAVAAALRAFKADVCPAAGLRGASEETFFRVQPPNPMR